MPKLIATRGHQEVDIEGDSFTIGRGKGNGLSFSTNNVSRKQAVITLEEGSYFLEDLGSRNGTYIGGKIISGKTKLEDRAAVNFARVYNYVFVL